MLIWIGSLKIFRYEDEGIVPFVANSPFMSFFYQQPAGEYRQHMNKEGELVPANREWHERNGTYLFAYGLGSVIVAYGIMIALHPWLPGISAVGSFLVFVMSFVTLSFLITDARVLGPGPWQFGARLPATLRRRPAGHQGRNHGRGCAGHHGRFGKRRTCERELPQPRRLPCANWH